MSESDKFWDKVADKYSKKPVPDEAMYKKKLAETQSLLSDSMRVLEFGCGTGTTAIHHAPYVQHIDAIDSSQRMVEIARKKAADAGVGNITFTRGTLEKFGAVRSGQNSEARRGFHKHHWMFRWLIFAVHQISRTCWEGVWIYAFRFDFYRG